MIDSFVSTLVFKEANMSKTQNAQKQVKRKPEKSLKEKRVEKKTKRISK